MLKKFVLGLIRFIVGGLFIFSGLIKVNDPIGTSIKMEEYFHVFSQDIAGIFGYLMPVSLPLSVVMITLEVVLGVMLILGVKRNWTLGLLSAMILFFTFLTFYSAYFNKVTDCGCFGDAIKLTPWQSFYKDIFLLVLIGTLVLFRKSLPEQKAFWAQISVVLAFFGALGLSLWAIWNLPFLDFRPYKEGVNITQAMQPSGELEYQYIMKKDGAEVVLDQYPKEDGYEFVDMKLKNPEVLPKISDFAIWNEQGDFTETILKGNKIIILISNFHNMDPEVLEGFDSLIDLEVGKTVIITASSDEEIENLMENRGWDVPYYFGDATVIKTMIRSNPGLMLIQDGIILKKYHYSDIPETTRIKSLFTP
ncbi:DoxX family protein [Echinicola jeungdonensis]|uniref:BT_3928 family protein n=1 Tax=Echinicola jeungdonensis TaxID=709343 RepID=A0ABV5J1S4_9BACT|nr:BT_3928 family protein [Echinicola jeungdonensis]MDN3668301.1 DoxX family protein [Echinicola jeungdonensis]